MVLSALLVTYSAKKVCTSSQKMVTKISLIFRQDICDRFWENWPKRGI